MGSDISASQIDRSLRVDGLKKASGLKMKVEERSETSGEHPGRTLKGRVSLLLYFQGYNGYDKIEYLPR